MVNSATRPTGTQARLALAILTIFPARGTAIKFTVYTVAFPVQAITASLALAIQSPVSACTLAIQPAVNSVAFSIESPIASGHSITMPSSIVMPRRGIAIPVGLILVAAIRGFGYRATLATSNGVRQVPVNLGSIGGAATNVPIELPEMRPSPRLL